MQFIPKLYKKILALVLIGLWIGFTGSRSYADSGVWGAIAIDDHKNIGGASNNLSSEQEAAGDAIKICQQNGGEHCLALLTFHGCAAVLRAHDKFYYGQAPYSLRGERDAIGKAMFTYKLRRGDFRVLASTCNYPLDPDLNG